MKAGGEWIGWMDEWGWDELVASMSTKVAGARAGDDHQAPPACAIPPLTRPYVALRREEINIWEAS